jgi:hypothetical protein
MQEEHFDMAMPSDAMGHIIKQLIAELQHRSTDADMNAQKGRQAGQSRLAQADDGKEGGREREVQSAKERARERETARQRESDREREGEGERGLFSCTNMCRGYSQKS